MMTKDNEEVIRNPYAIEIIENDNLQKLFDWKEKLYFAITGGGMSFHFNSKLCVNEIHALQDITKYDLYYDRAHDSIGYETNGYDEICHATGVLAYTFVDGFVLNVRINKYLQEYLHSTWSIRIVTFEYIGTSPILGQTGG